MFYLHKREFDYAIRICAYLAGLGKNDIIPVSQLAKKLLISKPFATKIIYSLRINKIVGSRQGKHGGIFLNRSAAEITLLEILNSVGLIKKTSDCIQETDFCPLPAPCKIHSYFMQIEENISNQLLNKKISEFKFTDEDIKTTNN